MSSDFACDIAGFMPFNASWSLVVSPPMRIVRPRYDSAMRYLLYPRAYLGPSGLPRPVVPSVVLRAGLEHQHEPSPPHRAHVLERQPKVKPGVDYRRVRETVLVAPSRWFIWRQRLRLETSLSVSPGPRPRRLPSCPARPRAASSPTACRAARTCAARSCLRGCRPAS